MKRLLLGFLCIFSAVAKAEELKLSDFIPEKLMLDEKRLYIISSFEEIAYLTAYFHNGFPAWELNFNSKVISYEVKDEKMFIFSKDRNGKVYYLTCIDVNDGKVEWEKLILAPAPANEPEGMAS